jgi:molybdenum cofactor synthesis domain-containing protein
MAQRAGIVLVGNEILSGKVIDANAAYLCRELRDLGVDVRRIAVIPDDVDEIAREVAAFSRAFDAVFTSGGVGPTHDDVTIEGVARALGVRVVRHPALVAALERYYQERLGTAAVLGEPHLKMAEVPEGAELLADGNVRFPTIRMGNVYILPGVPEIFRQKFEALRERFRDSPFHLRSVFVRIPEGTLAEHLNELLRRRPDLMLGSYPEFLNPEYKVKVTLESKDAKYVEQALEEFLQRLPADAVVRVEQ